MVTAARKTKAGPDRSHAKRKPPGKRHAMAEPPLPAERRDESDAAADAPLTFDIGESRRDKPAAAFDAWPVDREMDASVDDPSDKQTPRPVGS